MNNHLKEFNQKKEDNLLSNSAYYNLLYDDKKRHIETGTPKISIIIPTHNRFEQLTELVNSIYNQTYQNFEIILIDDVSNDKTSEVYSNYYDKRLKYYLNYENLGIGLNRQKGYNLSHGDYIIFSDDDDYFIDNNYFFDLIRIFENEEVNVICSESYTHDETEDKYIYSSINLDEGKIDSIEYLKNFMTKYRKPTSLFPAAFRRKAMIQSNFKEMTMMNDASIYLRALMIGGKTFINKKIVGIYRIHGANYTFNTKPDFIIKNLEEKKKIYNYLKKHELIPNINEWYAEQIAITVNYHLRITSNENDADSVLNWVYENVSYDEYLNYKKQIVDKYGLEVYYYKFPNVGDLLNETILSSIFKLKFEHHTFPIADLSGAGSILDLILTNSHFAKKTEEMLNECDINKPIHIWGSGLMYDYGNIDQQTVRPFIIHALRGEKTRKRLCEILKTNIKCVLADPGLLSSLLVEASGKKYSIGIVPHYVDKDEAIFKKMLEHYPNSKFIDVQNKTENVLKEISMCDYIISTSLHGLIIADSYGIPNCWCEISDKILGNNFKFHDYFSSFGTDREVFDLRKGNLPNINNDFKCNFKSIKQVYKKQKELINCFPFK